MYAGCSRRTDDVAGTGAYNGRMRKLWARIWSANPAVVDGVIGAVVAIVSLPAMFPDGQLATIVGLASFAGVLAALGPARPASRLNVL